jgi:hypothetical protein
VQHSTGQHAWRKVQVPAQSAGELAVKPRRLARRPALEGTKSGFRAKWLVLKIIVGRILKWSILNRLI